MAYERALRWILRHDRQVNPTLGGRVYPPGEVPQHCARPYLTFRSIGQAGNTRHQGGDPGLVADSVLVAAWADDYTAAAELQRAVRQALVGQQGEFDGQRLEGIFADDKRTESEAPADRGEHSLQAASMVLAVWHWESES